MNYEILGLPIIPNVIVLFSLVFIDSNGMKSDNFTYNKENYTREDPIEVKDDLDEKPRSCVIHIEVPRTEVLLNDIDHE